MSGTRYISTTNAKECLKSTEVYVNKEGVVPYQQPRKKTSTQPAIDTFNEIIPPIDFSFCRIENIADAKEEEPRYPASPRGKGKQQAVPVEGTKSSGQCLKLNNNSISNLGCLVDFAKVKFINWECIAWIDLSQNELQKLGPELTEFVSLKILYLHGNQINDIDMIEHLQPLPELRKLTLHGNPLENMKGYRWFVLSKLPRLQSLDFSCVTKADRMTSGTWGKMNSWGIKKKKKASEED